MILPRPLLWSYRRTFLRVTDGAKHACEEVFCIWPLNFTLSLLPGWLSSRDREISLVISGRSSKC